MSTTNLNQSPPNFDPPPLFSKTDILESSYIAKQERLSRLRAALSLFVLAASLGIVGCEGHALHVYHETHLGVQWHLPLWPSDFDIRPTIALLSGGVVTAVGGLVYLSVAAVPSPRPRLLILNILALAAYSSSFVTMLIVLAFSAYVNSRVNDSASTGRQTLESWACRWSNAGMARLCKESRASVGLGVGTTVLALAGVGVVGWGIWEWWGMRRMRKQQEETGMEME